MERRSAAVARRRARLAFLWVPLLLVCACSSKPLAGDDARGLGLSVATLTPPEQIRVYSAAVRAAFDIGPDLALKLEPNLLPRSSGYEGGMRMPSELLSAFDRSNLIDGTCTPARQGEMRAPTCEATRAGYVLRVSDIFRRGGDTLLVYLLSEIYAKEGSGQQPFAFEMAYEMIPAGNGWRVVREGRVRQSGTK